LFEECKKKCGYRDFLAKKKEEEEEEEGGKVIGVYILTEKNDPQIVS
jgi:hypothetical protein